MQPLARDGYSTEQVRAMLLADNIDLRGGVELLDLNLDVVEDLTPHLGGGTVTRTMFADIHGACSITLTSPLPWGFALVRVYVTVAALGRQVRFNEGVFVLSAPADEAGESSRTYTVQGRDLLHLLRRPVAVDYEVAAGTGYLAAMRQVVTDAGLPPGTVLLDGSAEDKTLPSAKQWPRIPTEGDPATYLRVFNDLADPVVYRGVWNDENGRYRSGPYVPPGDRAPEFVFDADSRDTIVGKKSTRKLDVTEIPNRWQFIQTNRPDGAPPPSVGDGIYEYTNASDGLSSVAARGGFDWTRTVQVDAADQDALEARGKATIAADLAAGATFEVSTGPFPAAGHFDLFTYRDSRLGFDGLVQATRWQLDLTGGDMTWTWQAV